MRDDKGGAYIGAENVPVIKCAILDEFCKNLFKVLF